MAVHESRDIRLRADGRQTLEIPRALMFSHADIADDTKQLEDRKFASLRELLTVRPIEEIPSNHQYPVLPRGATLASAKVHWIVTLQSHHSNFSVRVHIVDDIVLGREQGADFDLAIFGEKSRGVSRRHLMLRPTSTCIFAIEVGSTNGSQLNGIPLGQGIARRVANGDLLTLGDLHLTIGLTLNTARR